MARSEMTRKDMETRIRALGFTVRVVDGEIRVAQHFGNGKHDRALSERTAYYTNDRADAVRTAEHWAARLEDNRRHTDAQFAALARDAAAIMAARKERESAPETAPAAPESASETDGPAGDGVTTCNACGADLGTNERGTCAGCESGRPVDGFEIVNHGAEHAQYFQGCGVAFTDYTHAYTGAGEDAAEAYADAVQSAAQDGWNVAALPLHPVECSPLDRVPEDAGGEDSEWYVYVTVRLRAPCSDCPHGAARGGPYGGP